MRGSNFYDDVCIVPYRAEWPRRFRLTKQLIIALLLEDDIECYVRHVGGTAIPGMYCKPSWMCWCWSSMISWRRRRNGWRRPFCAWANAAAPGAGSSRTETVRTTPPTYT